MPDPEIAAIATVVETLEPLEPAVRQRVIHYVQQRFLLTLILPSSSLESRVDPQPTAVAPTSAPAVTTPSRWADFGELFYAYRPTSNSEKVLIAGYWLQQVEQKPSFNSFEVNKKLKDMGEGIPKNIFRDFERLARETPSRLIFLSGSGTGRNVCKLTVPGLKSVEERVSRPQ